MILWTIQDTGAWERSKRAGVLKADARRADRWFGPAYHWMADQMRARIGLPPGGQKLPIWAWLRWAGNRGRPDLRATGHLPRGTRGGRIEFQPDEPVLLSDFDLWHFVLNYWYLPTSEEDGERFEADLARRGLSFYQTKPLPDALLHRAILESWERIFDLDWTAEGIAGPRARKSIQATVWQVRLTSVRTVTEFVAR
jgi:hypothetical protein